MLHFRIFIAVDAILGIKDTLDSINFFKKGKIFFVAKHSVL